ncbi:tRNA (5-methylaminomethyl-2-thiouridine)(34)-methyltransferase MnmD [Capnocytophaga sp. H2931]|uniref:tRNA (5-methylaminomethyl-2-thiouridine)(34)-methyltransferase MnmD n=1 Tax=Capnocytophaga sp. H2931 TaxID=1945657 RepID=UPI000BB1BF14|nr:tRNA (5-methylaminomethyl-2-thiouridine)(34)-methyltransferase MnmD [Capnocytophaga sp. H2931]ATA74185.1 SAM-dependent methyltransferase [Capnocytophaga sp. H2931]
MNRQVITTSDGSTTIHIPEWNENFHSKHGALQEAMHVFIKNGLQLFENRQISILEIGFGTGLNALVTYIEHQNLRLQVHYEGIEAYPLSWEEAQQMNYTQIIGNEKLDPIFEHIHQSDWQTNIPITETFTLKKRRQQFETIDDINRFDLIYFDAFGARVQPELWEEIIFEKMHKALKNEGVLVTYSAKGSVQRAMRQCGFQVEKLAGPPGKREMLRAKKSCR